MEFIGDDGISWCNEARRQWKLREFEFDAGMLEYFTDMLPKGFKVLDMGCNIANWYAPFQDLGADYVGVDASPVAIELARERYPGVTFILKNLKEIDFVEEFDLAFSHTVLQHMHVETKDVVFPKVFRALKPGGLFVFQEKCDVLTPTTFTIPGWICYAENFRFEFVKYHDPAHGFVFRRPVK